MVPAVARGRGRVELRPRSRDHWGTAPARVVVPPVMLGSASLGSWGSGVISGPVLWLNKQYIVYKRVGQKCVAGWLAPQVLAILGVLDSAQRSKNVSGAVAEIGVHHGRLFIGLNLLRKQGEYSVAIDVFGNQELNTDKSGKGDLEIFCKNVLRWSSLDEVMIHQGDSTDLPVEELRRLAHGDIRLFSVDGGHEDATVFSDMKLAESALARGGILIADDVFNEQWPGVVTGTLRYLNSGGELVPFAIGFNKVFFSMPEFADFYRESLRRHFASNMFTFERASSFAAHDVVNMARVPRRPRRLLARNRIARQLYHQLRRISSQLAD